MKRLLLTLFSLLLLTSTVHSQTPIYTLISGFCENGNQQAITSGIRSSNRVQLSYPSCRITVFNYGTGTVATVFSDNQGTALSNPFFANTSGQWFFYGTGGSHYNVQLDQAGIPSAFTLADRVAPALIRSDNTDTAVGIGAMSTQTQNQSLANVAMGFNALQHNVNSAENTCIGYFSCNGIGNNGGNTALGSLALQTLGSAGGNGTDNIAIGWHTLVNANSTSNNSAVGAAALGTLTSGSNNTGVGHSALVSTTTGNNNTCTGDQCLVTNSTGSQNTADGQTAGNNNTTGNDNTFLGFGAGYFNTTASFNTLVGMNSGITATPANANLTGQFNTWVGFGTGADSTTQLSNTCILGTSALAHTSNTCVIGNVSVTDVYLGSITGAANLTTSTVNGTNGLFSTLVNTPTLNLVASGTNKIRLDWESTVGVLRNTVAAGDKAFMQLSPTANGSNDGITMFTGANQGPNPTLSINGMVQSTAVAFSVLPGCGGGTEGSMRAVNDSMTNTWGAVITGSGTNHVLAYCDGTNWTVMAK
jgi:hypothetical protein